MIRPCGCVSARSEQRAMNRNSPYLPKFDLGPHHEDGLEHHVAPHSADPTYLPQQQLSEEAPSPRARRTQIRPEEARFDVSGWRRQPGFVQQTPVPAETKPAISEIGAAGSENDFAATPRRSTGSSAGYLALWGGLGLISAAYIATMTWQRNNTVEVALAPVTETLERMATDIADLKQTTAAIDAQERATAARLTMTESRVDGIVLSTNPLQNGQPPAQNAQNQRPTNRSVLAEDLPPAAPAPEVATAREPAKPARVVAAAAPPTAPPPAAQPAPPVMTSFETRTKPATTAKVSPRQAAAATNPIVTASLPTPASAPVPVPVPPALATRPIGLLIASGPSLESIRLSWTVLNQTHSNVLGGMEPRIVPADDGSAFQLIAGPFASDADAQKACASLKAKGVGCKAAAFAGAAL